MSRPIRFSANLGFLWNDLPLQEALQAAAHAGFRIVEMHQPFHVPATELARQLGDLNMSVMSLNTGVGDAEQGEIGLAAVPGREAEARALMDQAIEYAAVIGSRFVSVVVGRTGRTEMAEQTLRRNLAHGAQRAAAVDVGLLIEPLNTNIADDLHLVRVADAVSTIRSVGADNISVMADTFHVMTMEGSLESIEENLEYIGHIQVSGWPDRGEPTRGIDFPTWLTAVTDQGYSGIFGAEYTPRGSIDAGLGWRDVLTTGGET